MASRKRYRYTFEVVFFTEDDKASFSERMESVRRRLEADSGVRLNNHQLLSQLLTLAEDKTTVTSPQPRPERLLNKNAAILDVQGCIYIIYTYTCIYLP